ncbi:FAD-dependent oxidoreductase [Sinirhodobacter populi]|uniref:FAD-dependent oxidoreductase n=1 Tax=Paenirhodobacter populi TaxID=2306993 RepID=A0A443KCB5_9RHOB|nr:FAD/NAD(P)-binding protein [Sinirhodobacter populi]RWR30366.1 FAD-dependent oxidoreductase [Sinirhodobacter populi]
MTGTKAQIGDRPTVAIIGGGLSGAAVAWHLARLTPAPRIVVIEPRAELGQGLAYGTPDPAHKLNVPAQRMTLDTSDPLHFQRWLSSSEGPFLPAGSATLAGDIFAPRQVFGRYVAHHLRPFLDAGRIEHLRSHAQAARREGEQYRITLVTGEELRADRLVLAVSHPEPSVPRGLRALTAETGLIRDPYAPDALAGIAPDENVLIVGTGLTGADIVASLQERGHRGKIHLLSRHGRFSQPHGPAQDETGADFTVAPERTTLGLLRRVRRALAVDAEGGLTWHAVFDRLRTQAPAIWAALPQGERRRLLRHLRGLWDIHRFRIAPQTHDTLLRAIAARRVEPIAGAITDATVAPEGIALDLHLRGGGERRLTVDRVVLATGPAHAAAFDVTPVLASLEAGGTIRRDPLGLGILTTTEGNAIDATGVAQETLLIAGPLARGAVGELMGVPEITARAEGIARKLARSLPDAEAPLVAPDRATA